jgi:hypothetical protein
MALLLAGAVLGSPGTTHAQDPSVPTDSVLSGTYYTNYQAPEVPLSIHLVRFERSNSRLEVHSMHAGRGVLGLSTLSAQTRLIDPAIGTPVAAVNGDFYQRDKTYAGDPRGLQILDGELLHGPNGGASFWIDAQGQPRTTNILSLFQVTWPNGTATPLGVNGDRGTNGIELYTPAIGTSTHTIGGRELVLERQGPGPWLPLEIGRTYHARVREVRETGDTPMEPATIVLSIGPRLLNTVPNLETGAVLRLSMATFPNLRGAKTAISGGPVLVRGGKRQKIQPASVENYEFSSMLERHPRTAIGWNKQYFYLVEVDGRQKELSVGMTLDELSAWLQKQGCEEALNFDGGGSATLWYNGKVQNSPCDRVERGIANSLMVIRKAPSVVPASAQVGNSAAKARNN